MADKPPALFTFHKIREHCEEGSADAWRAFLNFYAPLWLRLLEIYSPLDSDAAPGILEKMIAALTENDFARFRATSRQSEREFLSDVRVLLMDITLDGGAERPLNCPGEWGTTAIVASLEPAASASGRRVLDLETLGKLVAGLPLLHQEMVFFKLSGYTEATIELVMRMKPSVAQSAFARLEPDYAAAQRLEKDRCPWPGEWLAVLRDARATKKENCPPLHRFLRVRDGQVSWYDKEPVERHVAGCLYCLERWTALREVGYWRRVAPPVDASQIERFMQAIPVATAPTKSFVKRLFG